MSEFLKNLKSSLENGEFNSESAKKITEIVNLSERKLMDGGLDKIQEQLNQRLDQIKQNDVPIEESSIAYEKYTKRLKNIAISDSLNKLLAAVINLDYEITNTALEIRSFVNQAIDIYSSIEEDKSRFSDVYNRIIEIGDKY